MKKVKFIATVALGRGLDKIRVPFELETKTDEMGFSWDDVYYGGWDATTSVYPEKDFPNMEITNLEISMEDGNYPVVSEDFDKDELKALGCKKALVLGYDRYSLSPEFKLFLDMKKKGLLGNRTFDKDEMREIIDMSKMAEKSVNIPHGERTHEKHRGHSEGKPGKALRRRK